MYYDRASNNPSFIKSRMGAQILLRKKSGTPSPFAPSSTALLRNQKEILEILPHFGRPCWLEGMEADEYFMYISMNKYSSCTLRNHACRATVPCPPPLTFTFTSFWMQAVQCSTSSLKTNMLGPDLLEILWVSIDLYVN